MSRPLRIQKPGLWHHVMNRGMEQRAIFIDDEDAGTFFDLVADAGERWQVWCHAACLMNTHYHLLLHDQGGSLSRAMRHIDGVFTQSFNRRRKRDGPLMSGRYLSRVVEREGYLLEVIRYIHTNPVEAGLVNRAAEYAWSSHCWYLEPGAPSWLQREAVFERFGSDAQAREAFDTFVHERVPEPIRAALRPRRWTPIVGSEQFVLKWKERIRKSQSYRNREVPEARRSSAWSVEAVLKTACRVFGCRRTELIRGTRGMRHRGRELAMLACRQHTGAGNTQLGRAFGVAAATVPTAVRRTRGSLEQNGAMRRDYERLSLALGLKSQAAT
jgi:REP element-mobilizing transposase RayT